MIPFVNFRYNLVYAIAICGALIRVLLISPLKVCRLRLVHPRLSSDGRTCYVKEGEETSRIREHFATTGGANHFWTSAVAFESEMYTRT
jgi:hypothetical protein